MVDAVVLAGRRNVGALRGVSDAQWEALVPIAGRPMGAWVIDALQRSGRCARIIAVGPPELWDQLGPQDAVVAPSDDLIENVRRGVRSASTGERLLIATSDIPMLTPEGVRAFVDAAATQAEFHYPVIARGDVERRFPGNRRTYVRLRDGTFTGGNMVLLDPHCAERALGFAEQFVALRKQPWRLALKVGVPFMVRLLLGQATVAEAEERFSRLLGIRAKAVPLPFAEIGVDVDRPEDVPYCEGELRRTGGAG